MYGWRHVRSDRRARRQARPPDPEAQRAQFRASRRTRGEPRGLRRLTPEPAHAIVASASGCMHCHNRIAMNLIAKLLPGQNVVADLDVGSKKRVFEHAGLLFE